MCLPHPGWPTTIGGSVGTSVSAWRKRGGAGVISHVRAPPLSAFRRRRISVRLGEEKGGEWERVRGLGPPVAPDHLLSISASLEEEGRQSGEGWCVLPYPRRATSVVGSAHTWRKRAANGTGVASLPGPRGHSSVGGRVPAWGKRRKSREMGGLSRPRGQRACPSRGD